MVITNVSPDFNHELEALENSSEIVNQSADFTRIWDCRNPSGSRYLLTFGITIVNSSRRNLCFFLIFHLKFRLTKDMDKLYKKSLPFQCQK